MDEPGQHAHCRNLCDRLVNSSYIAQLGGGAYQCDDLEEAPEDEEHAVHHLRGWYVRLSGLDLSVVELETRE